MKTQPTQRQINLMQDRFGVSRETLDRLQIYADLLVKWQARINLVSATTLDHLWQRHIIDSLQLVSELRRLTPKRILDVGSGGGFPGLVVAIAMENEITMVEAVSKKIAFLRAVASATNAKIVAENVRLENLTRQDADVITARAFAPLPRLLGWSVQHLTPSGSFCLLKGAEWEEEIQAAKADGWNFSHSVTPSLTDPSGVILLIQEVTHDADYR